MMGNRISVSLAARPTALSLLVAAACILVSPTFASGAVTRCSFRQVGIVNRPPLFVGGGRVSFEYLLTNNGKRACALNGYPRVLAIDAAGHVVTRVRVIHTLGASSGPPGQGGSRIVLATGQSAWLEVISTDGTGMEDTSYCHVVKGIRFLLPGGSSPSRRFPFSTCSYVAVSFFITGSPPN